MIYFIVFVILLYFSYRFDYIGEKKYKKKCYYLVLILLILIAGLRYRLGVDTIRYESSFQWIPNIFDLTFSDFDNKYDPFYLIFSSISKTLSPEFWVMQILQATLVNVIVFRFIKRNINNIFFGVLLYYVFLYFNYTCEVMREACAVSMFLLAWEYFKKKEWSKYYIFCIAAFLFHNSAILLFILPVLKWFKVWSIMRIKGYTVFLLIGVLIIGFIIQKVFFDYLYIISITDNIENKLNSYSNSDLSGSLLNLNGIISVVLRYILYPFIAVVLLKNRSKHDELIIEPMVLLCFIFAILSIPIAILYRYNNYFMLFAILVLADLAFSKKFYLSGNKILIVNSYFLWFILFAPLISFQVYGLFSNVKGTMYKEYMRYYPYNSVLDRKRDMQREALFIYYNAY